MTESTLLNACRTLFGQEVRLDRDFLHYLQPSGAKLAYRNQVKANHPDRFNDSPTHIRERQAERFREIHDAYQLLLDFFSRKHLVRFTATQPSTRQTTSGYSRRGSRPTRKAYTTPSAMRPQVPAIALEFGMFAYYQGKVAYQDLIEALVWQRRQRPRFGTIAMKWGWLNEGQIKRIMQHRGRSQRFGKKARELGLLTQLQVDALLRHQQDRQQRIGEYFVAKGLMTTEEAETVARALAHHNRCVLGRQRSQKSRL